MDRERLQRRQQWKAFSSPRPRRRWSSWQDSSPSPEWKTRLWGIFSYSHAYKDTMFFLKTTHLLMRHLCFRLSTHVGLVEHKPGNKTWYKYHLSSPVRLRLSPVVKNCQSGTGLSPRGPEKVSQSWVFQLLEKTRWYTNVFGYTPGVLSLGVLAFGKDKMIL